MFYFEVQTGLVREEPPTTSNFWNYLLRNSARSFIKDGVQRAVVGEDGYLAYPEGFMEELEIWIKSTDTLLRGAARWNMELPERAQ